MRVLVLVSCCVGFAACLPRDDAAATEPPVTGCIAIGPRVSPATATRHVGDTLRVVAAPPPACGGPAVAVQFIWTVSDTAVASVDSLSGFVQARRSGVVTVIASEQTAREVQGAMVLLVDP